MSTYRAAVLTGERQIGIREFELAPPTGRQVLVKVDSCAICTLEQRIYGGVMKRYPFAGGHEIAGTVEAVGGEVRNLAPGDRVAPRLLTSCGECYYCRSGYENQCVISFKAAVHDGIPGPGGFSEYMLVDARSIYKIAEDLDLVHATLTEPLACCVHSVGNGCIRLGDDVVVIGAGVMGALHIRLAKLRGARVIACELDENRLEVARRMGADLLINSGRENAVERVRQLTEGRGADVVFCTVAVSRLAAESIEMAGKLGRVVFYSSFHPDTPIELSANRVHSSEVIITGAVNPRTSDFLAATKLLSSKLVDVSLLISEVVPFGEVGRAFELASKPQTYRIVVKCDQGLI